MIQYFLIFFLSVEIGTSEQKDIILNNALQIHIFTCDGHFSSLLSFSCYNIEWLIKWKKRLLRANPYM